MASLYDSPYYTGAQPWYKTSSALPKSSKTNITPSATTSGGVKTPGTSTSAPTISSGAKTSSNSSSSDAAKKQKKAAEEAAKKQEREIEKQREAAAKALERQMNEQLGGLESSYGANRSVIQNMMQQLDPTYAKYRQDYESQMNEQKQKDINALTAQFAAYGTSDSEQRNQAQERLYNDYSRNMSDYLTEAASKQSDQMREYENQMTQLGGQYAQQQADVRAQKFAGQASAEEKFAQLLAAAKQQSFENNLAMQQFGLQQSQAAAQQSAASQKARGTAAPKTSLYQMATQMKNAGKSWGDIAYELGNAGFDLTPGNENSAALDAIMTGTAPKQSKLMNLGNGMLLDEESGDIFSAY